MTAQQLEALKPGRHYKTRVRDGRQRVRRAFKWLERRMDGTILCAVFTTKIGPDVKTEGDGHSFRVKSNHHMPAQELSIPHYDLMECEEC